MQAKSREGFSINIQVKNNLLKAIDAVKRNSTKPLIIELHIDHLFFTPNFSPQKPSKLGPIKEQEWDNRRETSNLSPDIYTVKHAVDKAIKFYKRHAKHSNDNEDHAHKKKLTLPSSFEHFNYKQLPPDVQA